MAQCWRCGKSGMFLKLSSAGLCIECLEAAADTSIHIVSMIKSGGAERKKALAMLDEMTAEEMISKIEYDLKRSPFNVWGANIHQSAEQVTRIRRSETVSIIEYKPATRIAIAQGSNGNTYTTTYENCTCGDFVARKLPCKHMYKLASEHGGIDFLKHL